jgi:hypothetical protein
LSNCCNGLICNGTSCQLATAGFSVQGSEDDQATQCIPLTCAELGCGRHDDGCGNPLHCGPCCTPRDYCNAGECGMVDDGCGGSLDCGQCSAPAVPCSGEGERCADDNQCCNGLCRGRNCQDRGQKICQAACAA